MKVIHFIICAPMLLAALFVNAKDTAPQQVKLSPSVNIAKDINQLYMTAIDQKTAPSTRKNIICKQLPTLLNQYEDVTLSHSHKTVSDSLKQNIKVTQDHYKISCR